MIKIIESPKIEFSLIALSFGFELLNIMKLPWGTRALFIALSILMLIYMLRIFTSFRRWRLSRGISVVNAILNFQLFTCTSAILFTLLAMPGDAQMVMVALGVPEFYIVFIALFLLIRWRKLDKQLYWKMLKWNVARAAVGLIICMTLFQAFDMSHFHPH
jgi:hypothetical protein